MLGTLQVTSRQAGEVGTIPLPFIPFTTEETEA